MPREVIESAKIVWKTDDGNRLEVEGKGSAPRIMVTAFSCFPVKRREWMLKRMQEEHAKCLEAEAARAG